VQSILRDRARTLALRDETELGTATEALAAFTIGGHHIATPMAQVTRAATLRHLTEIPGGPPYLVGVTAVDGHVVSLLDLTVFLDLARHGVGDITGLLVVAVGTREIGLAAEQLLGVEDVPRRAISPLPGAAGPLSRVARTVARDLLVLDVERLLDDPRLGTGATAHG
jgi:chemotaxis signal transduction protein